MRLTRSNSWSVTLLAIIFLPGVIIHELSHLLTAGILQVPVGEVSFTPEIREDDVRLGRVMIGHADPIRRAIIGFAPVIMGNLIIFISFYYFSTLHLQGNILFDLLFFFVLFEIGNTMFSSKKDLEGTLEILLPLTFIFLVIFIMGFRAPFYFLIDLANSNSESLKSLPLFLAPAIILDGVLFLILKLIGRR